MSVRHKIMRIEETIHNTQKETSEKEIVKQTVTLKLRTEQNSYSAKLHMIVWILKQLLYINNKLITILSSNQTALQMLYQLKQQLKQATVQQIYKVMR